MQNPITEAREELGLSRHQFGLIAGVGYAEVWRSEAGYARSLHPRLVRFLKQEGIRDDPQEAYEEWLDERGEEVRVSAKLKRQGHRGNDITWKGAMQKKEGDSQ